MTAFLVFLAVFFVLLLVGMGYLLRTPQRPIVKTDDAALRRAQLDVASQLGKSPSVIRPRARNGRL